MHPADREILDHFLRIRERTIDLLVRIPDDLLDRTAPGEDRPTRRWFFHLARVVDAWMDELMRDGGGMLEYRLDRDGLVEALRLSAHRLIAFFAAEGGPTMA